MAEVRLRQERPHPHRGGGYGRGELHPHSDIDLLILYDGDELDEVLGLRIGEFITLLWDLKLEVGQAVRNVAECLEQGRADITVATNLIEARYITGRQEGFRQLKEATGPQHFWPSEAFFAPSARSRLNVTSSFSAPPTSWSRISRAIRVACVIFKPSPGSPAATLAPLPCSR